MKLLSSYERLENIGSWAGLNISILSAPSNDGRFAPRLCKWPQKFDDTQLFGTRSWEVRIQDKKKYTCIVLWFPKVREGPWRGVYLFCLFLDPPMWVPITKSIHYVYGCRIFVKVSLGMLCRPTTSTRWDKIWFLENENTERREPTANYGWNRLEFEKLLLEVQGFMKITLHFRGIYEILPHFNKVMVKDHNIWLVGVGNTRIWLITPINVFKH